VEFILSLGRTYDISERIVPKGWRVLSKMWCVARTFSWLPWFRQLSKDYEMLKKSKKI
jgi:transposase